MGVDAEPVCHPHGSNTMQRGTRSALVKYAQAFRYARGFQRGVCEVDKREAASARAMAGGAPSLFRGAMRPPAINRMRPEDGRRTLPPQRISSRRTHKRSPWLRGG
eukprot:scaffold3586_cov404-Prasinococcus_capsulatus_cf.AAC.13